ncbi:hypothetical protein [Nonomuraea typhae]|uniref:DUF3885 domain-containing protein n=1 Tax=Nonomuraea typhae TaxID=2603600 RepID=A0ABW7YXB4_9ACTN
MTWRVVADAWPELTARWRANWPGCAPVAHELKHYDAARWVRFHSLPNAKRHADTPAEYDILLNRHNTVLTTLFADEDLYVVTATHTSDGEITDLFTHPEPVTLNLGARPWLTLTRDDGYSHLLATRRRPRPRGLDPLLRAVADAVLRDVLITDLRMRRIYHPYDGGADCILENTEARRLLETVHADWLPAG